METRYLGKTGVSVSNLCLATSPAAAHNTLGGSILGGTSTLLVAQSVGHRMQRRPDGCFRSSSRRSGSRYFVAASATTGADLRSEVGPQCHMYESASSRLSSRLFHQGRTSFSTMGWR